MEKIPNLTECITQKNSPCQRSMMESFFTKIINGLKPLCIFLKKLQRKYLTENVSVYYSISILINQSSWRTSVQLLLFTLGRRERVLPAASHSFNIILTLFLHWLIYINPWIINANYYWLFFATIFNFFITNKTHAGNIYLFI